MTPDRDEDRLLEHDYDGIREYDNPKPKWGVYSFLGCIAYSALYLLNVPGIGIGAGRLAAYRRDMAIADSVLASQDPLRGVTGRSLRALAGHRHPAHTTPAPVPLH